MEFVGSVVSGIAALTQTMEDGRTPDGWPAAAVGFRGPPRAGSAPYDVTATTDLVMCCFRRKPFESMMDEPRRISRSACWR
jgi:CRP/FNR family transcriptional regulator